MTREEAVKQLTINRPSAYTELREAISMAIKALEQEPCEDTDAISRQAAIDTVSVGAELLRRVLDEVDLVGAEREKYEWGLGLIESCISDIKELPSAQPERKKGRWIAIENEEMETIGYYCSECDLPMETEYRTNFCPQCGSYNGGNDNGDE